MPHDPASVVQAATEGDAAGIAGLARDTDFRRFLLDAESEGAIRDLLTEMSGEEQA